MFCPEDGREIPFTDAESDGGEVRYGPCSKCGSRWTYVPSLTIGPCYVLESTSAILEHEGEEG